MYGIVVSDIFTLYIMFHLNVQDNSDDV